MVAVQLHWDRWGLSCFAEGHFSSSSWGLESTYHTIPLPRVSQQVLRVKPLTFWSSLLQCCCLKQTVTYVPSMRSSAAKTTHHLSLLISSLHTTVLITLTAAIRTTSIYKNIKSTLAVSLKSDHWDKLIPICLNWHYNLSLANWTQWAIWDLLPF